MIDMMALRQVYALVLDLLMLVHLTKGWITWERGCQGT